MAEPDASSEPVPSVPPGAAATWRQVSWLQQAAQSVRGGLQVLDVITEAVAPAIASHSVRVLRYAHALACSEMAQERLQVSRSPAAFASYLDDGTLLTACLLHDAGATAVGASWQRFEVQGADRAAAFARAHGYSEDQVRHIWEAVALHTSPHIAERIHPLARWVRGGVLADFGTDLIPPDLRRRTEAEVPRLDVERTLSGIVVEQALRDERRAPSGSWPADLLAAHRASADADARLSAF
ncbi:HD domain-containing protein [Kineococcus radiotolerans]|uniref:HD domain-containing protein n=1 Tax=Kineococcus radiotolerans (strain ATCC BAA-149 / DSM 14245 / SRS30216) TaxID=266940 RepID=A6WAF6_KINRD|nr:HD domain-containing protein [Kineococcus radiotolerans]ABS03795.1 hypothetical protein Krad_2314 [Kineococcus radiotolerans SRS30216 = ATCC BAA-149]